MALAMRNENAKQATIFFKRITGNPYSTTTTVELVRTITFVVIVIGISGERVYGIPSEPGFAGWLIETRFARRARQSRCLASCAGNSDLGSGQIELPSKPVRLG